jgi:uncharacterized protein YmfQ (DUF2313 family)
VIDVLPQMVALSEAYFQVYQCQQRQPALAAKAAAAGGSSKAPAAAAAAAAGKAPARAPLG